VSYQLLDEMGIDSICDRIIGGESQAAIARDLKIAPSILSRWLAADEQRSARAREARNASADAYADKAEEALLFAPPEQIEISRARELASHYRWMASKRRPTEYGERIQQDITATVEMKQEDVDARIAELLAKANEPKPSGEA
jgi:hypothetical protein